MSPINEGITSNGSLISFGNYSITEKLKVDNFTLGTDIYKLKTHNEITRLEKNGSLLFESVPGSTVLDFNLTASTVTFTAEGLGSSHITLELLPNQEYAVYINDEQRNMLKSNISGKISVGATLSSIPTSFKIEKI